MELEIRNLDAPDQTTPMTKGRLDVVSAGGVTVGRASYEPDWRWSKHAGEGHSWCEVEHVVLVIRGQMRIEMRDGVVRDVGPGDLCAIPPGHDAWVLGGEPYESLHFHGTEDYAAPGGGE